MNDVITILEKVKRCQSIRLETGMEREARLSMRVHVHVHVHAAVESKWSKLDNALWRINIVERQN